MDMHDAALPMAPGSEDLIRFPDQDCWYLTGDRQRAAMFRGAARQLKAGLVASSGGLLICSTRREYDDGTVIEVRKAGSIFQLSIHCPLGHAGPGQGAPQLVPGLQAGQFFWVPGCFTRFDFHDPEHYLHNSIPLHLKGQYSDDAIANEGVVGGFLTLQQAGLPSSGTSPGGLVQHRYGCLVFEGSSLDDSAGGHRLSLGSASLPTDGPFTISCLFRLHGPVGYDYTQTYQTELLGNGYPVFNVVKPRVLFSTDGEEWTAKCPGGLAPLVAYAIPSRFSRHWVRLSYPWPPYNEDFVSRSERSIGFMELESECPDAPLLATYYAADSPYWDKVELELLDVLSGEVKAAWDINGSSGNSDPYTSFCRFVVPENHEKAFGTRVSRMLQDGSGRYATVLSSFYDATGNTTTFVLQDWLHKRPIGSSGETAQMRFGRQPFPLNNPSGVVIGFNLLGMCFLNDGNMRLVAGKVVDFESGYANPPMVSEPLALGAWHHAVLTCSEEGVCRLYLAEQGKKTIAVASGNQSGGAFLDEDGFGVKEKIRVAAMNWRLVPTADSPDAAATGLWEYASTMDLGLLRFYHRELSSAECQLLTMEVFDGVFVADDHEAGQLTAAGYVPIIVSGRTA